MIFDLHSHTTASDGELTPLALISRARENGVACLAITDHDTIDAYGEFDCDLIDGVMLCPGVELSANWHGRSVHVVGLRIRLESSSLLKELEAQQNSRVERAEQIAGRLEKKGFDHAMEGARAFAGGDNIGRPHFAKFLVSIAAVRDERQAFKRYLGRGKIGDIQRGWPPVASVTSWIRDAGGMAVLAHPAHYRLTNTKLGVLADEFVEAGGTAMEVVSGKQSPELTRKLAELAAEKGLLASTGSDFHRPGAAWSELGRQTALPSHLKPVWDAW
ncbi:MAG: PHP domain-containing protein [Gammaproteobacteria bacterium]|nr:PHP domain-containing protein [Gammaproteobacteria bacterium]MDH4313912.1 PHP domain-containing protein [Gammaproteobacteria bacterium]MDH5213813.1 PHP domain-containing protein [Gammaproteobacteria bacterium]